VDIDQLIESEGLFVTTLPDGASFTWRLLTEKEFRVLSKIRDNGLLSRFQVHLEAFNRCYVGDHRMINGDLPAGIFLSIGELIMHLSGGATGHEADEIEAARANYADASVTEVMKRIVLMAFASYTPDVFESWTRAKLLERFVLAEALLQNRSEYQPIDTSKIMTPEQAAKQARKKSLPVDVHGDNREIRNAMGSKKHALDSHPSEFKDKVKSAKLNTAQARRLDKMSKSDERRQRSARRR